MPANVRSLARPFAPELHFACVPENVYRQIGFGMKAYFRGKVVGEWSARRHEDADLRPSLGDLADQVAPLIAPGILTSVNNSLMSAFVSKNRSAKSAFPLRAPGIRHPRT